MCVCVYVHAHICYMDVACRSKSGLVVHRPAAMLHLGSRAKGGVSALHVDGSAPEWKKTVNDGRQDRNIVKLQVGTHCVCVIGRQYLGNASSAIKA